MDRPGRFEMKAVRWGREYHDVTCVFEEKDKDNPKRVCACGRPSIGELGSGKFLCSEHFDYAVAIYKADVSDKDRK